MARGERGQSEAPGLMVHGLEFDDVILGLDIATKTGWGVVQGKFYRSGEMPFRPERRLVDFRVFLEQVVNQWKPAVILAEDVFINTHPSTKTLLHMHGVLLERMACCDSVFRYVGNKRAKTIIGGNGNMTAAEKKNGAMVRALNRFGFSVDGTDAADGLAIALVGRHDLFDGRIK